MKSTGILRETIKRDLIPNEAFREAEKDGSKIFTFIQCQKEFAKKQYVKSHIARIHCGKEMKRLPGSEEDVLKKPKSIGENLDSSFLSPEDKLEPASSTQLEENGNGLNNMEAFCDIINEEEEIQSNIAFTEFDDNTPLLGGIIPEETKLQPPYPLNLT